MVIQQQIKPATVVPNVKPAGARGVGEGGLFNFSGPTKPAGRRIYKPPAKSFTLRPAPLQRISDCPGYKSPYSQSKQT